MLWSGGVAPYGSFSHSESVQQSQLAKFISGISGESVKVTTKHLIYNVASITGSEELKLEAENIDHTELPQAENIDTEFKFMAAFSAGADGKMRGSIAGSYKDGDFVVSGGYFSALKVLFIRAMMQYQEDVGDSLTKIKHADIKEFNVEHSAFSDKAFLARNIKGFGEDGILSKSYNWLFTKGPFFDNVDIDLDGKNVDEWYKEFTSTICTWLKQNLDKKP